MRNILPRELFSGAAPSAIYNRKQRVRKTRQTEVYLCGHLWVHLLMLLFASIKYASTYMVVYILLFLQGWSVHIQEKDTLNILMMQHDQECIPQVPIQKQKCRPPYIHQQQCVSEPHILSASLSNWMHAHFQTTISMRSQLCIPASRFEQILLHFISR